MDITYNPEDWRRLGKILQQRRGQLGYGYRQRRKFLADRGGDSPPSDKMLDRLERGERTSYPDDTIAYLESLYGYAPGAFAAILQGREPPPASELRHLAAVPSPVTPDARLFALERIASLIPDASEAELGVLEKLAEVAAAGDETLELAYRMPDPLGRRVALMTAWVRDGAHRRPEEPAEAAGVPERGPSPNQSAPGPDILPEGMREFVHDAARGPQDEGRLIAIFEAQARGEPLPRFRKRRAAR